MELYLEIPYVYFTVSLQQETRHVALAQIIFLVQHQQHGTGHGGFSAGWIKCVQEIWDNQSALACLSLLPRCCLGSTDQAKALTGYSAYMSTVLLIIL